MGLYVLSRLITIFSERTPGEIGTVWLIMEARFFLIGIALAVKGKNLETKLVDFSGKQVSHFFCRGEDCQVRDLS
jgi:hypothetical protein